MTINRSSNFNYSPSVYDRDVLERCNLIKQQNGHYPSPIYYLGLDSYGDDEKDIVIDGMNWKAYLIDEETIADHIDMQLPDYISAQLEMYDEFYALFDYFYLAYEQPKMREVGQKYIIPADLVVAKRPTEHSWWPINGNRLVKGAAVRFTVDQSQESHQCLLLGVVAPRYPYRIAPKAVWFSLLSWGYGEN